MSKAPKRDRLATAAEALVQAASMEVDCITQQKLASNLDALKESFDSKLNTVTQSVNMVTQSVKASNENFDSKINTVNQNLANLQKDMSGVKALLEEEKKQKRLEMAMNMTDINSFRYYGENRSCESRDMAKTILKWFALGYGYNFSKSHRMNEYTYNDAAREKSQKEFRTKLLKQLKELIGHEPRLVDNGNNMFSVFYK